MNNALKRIFVLQNYLFNANLSQKIVRYSSAAFLEKNKITRTRLVVRNEYFLNF